MTPEQFKTLQPGDEAYYVIRRDWDTNAYVQHRDVFLLRVVVKKVSAKTVTTENGYRPKAEELLTLEEGAAAIEETTRRKEAHEALMRRWRSVAERIGAATSMRSAFGLMTSSISVSTSSIDIAESVASALDVGMAAIRLQGALREKITSESPAVHLHLSIDQAQRVLNLLEPSAESAAPVVDPGGPLLTQLDALLRDLEPEDNGQGAHRDPDAVLNIVDAARRLIREFNKR
jgi:hypothetical protein